SRGDRFYLSLPYLMIVTSTCILAIGNAFVENVKYTFIIEGLERDEAFYGILAFTWALSEVPLMFLSSALVKRYSWRMVMVMGFTFNIIKIGSYLFIQPLNSWLMIPVQFFNSFALFYPAYSYAITNEIAPRRKALALSMRQTLIQLGGFTGGLFGAWLSSNLATKAGIVEPFHVFFKLSITFSLVGLFSFGIIHLINHELNKRDERGK
ncbi:MFS transporter, partial [Candidatus Bathyarchaeota archaeon]|nr:MFS transporter [Candidatus Bathyarchaeota archaeon]